MKTYIITRSLKGVGAKPEPELCGMAKVSVETMEAMRKEGKVSKRAAGEPKPAR
jgi:hypothetical protein